MGKTELIDICIFYMILLFGLGCRENLLGQGEVDMRLQSYLHRMTQRR